MYGVPLGFGERYRGPAGGTAVPLTEPERNPVHFLRDAKSFLFFHSEPIEIPLLSFLLFDQGLFGELHFIGELLLLVVFFVHHDKFSFQFVIGSFEFFH